MKKRVLSLIVAVLLCVQMMPAMVMAAAENINVEASSENLPFTDVKPGDWFYDSVDYVYQQKFMTGMRSDYFGVSETLSRAQFAVVLYRMAGEPEMDEKQIFPDVPVNTETAWYAKAVTWANENKIILGYEDGRFGPTDSITREQIAAMLHRYVKYYGYVFPVNADLSKYPDAKDISDWATKDMQWAVENGIISGKGGKSLDPQGKTRRAECAAMAARFMQTYTLCPMINQVRDLVDAGKNEEAFALLSGAADTGDASVQYLLGSCYINGIGVEQDYEKAVEYFRLAADQGNAYGQSALGGCYYYGYGVEQNNEEAVNYCRLAADQGNADALYFLGLCYHNGICVERNLEEALKYYRLAADQGLDEAQRTLGWCYYYGQGVEQNDDEAFKYFRLAADQGLPNGQYYLGVCYYEGVGVEQNYEEAVKYYRLAADQGDMEAQNNLGVCYFNGEGVEQNYEEALKYWRLAADQGNPVSQYNLGWSYSLGEIVEQDDEEAAKYFLLAAEGGYSPAMFSIGDCYFEGSGVEKNLEEAAKWYQKALDTGYEPNEEDQEHLIAVLGEGYDKK